MYHTYKEMALCVIDNDIKLHKSNLDWIELTSPKGGPKEIQHL